MTLIRAERTNRTPRGVSFNCVSRSVTGCRIRPITGRSPTMNRFILCFVLPTGVTIASGIEVDDRTNYIVEINGSGGKTYEAVFDAVGRLKDMKSHHEMTMESAASAQKVTGKEADDASNWAKKIVPDAAPEGVYKSEV